MIGRNGSSLIRNGTRPPILTTQIPNTCCAPPPRTELDVNPPTLMVFQRCCSRRLWLYRCGPARSGSESNDILISRSISTGSLDLSYASRMGVGGFSSSSSSSPSPSPRLASAPSSPSVDASKSQSEGTPAEKSSSPRSSAASASSMASRVICPGLFPTGVTVCCCRWVLGGREEGAGVGLVSCF